MKLRPAITFAKQRFGDRPIKAVEVGVYKGENAKSILDTLNIEMLYLVDPYKVYDDPTSKMGKDEDFPLVELEAKERLKGYKNITWIKKESDAALADIPKVDFVYLDGNHDYPFVIRDMSNYWNKVKQGGVLAGHDIKWKAGVIQAFEEFVHENGLMHYSMKKGVDWLIKKR